MTSARQTRSLRPVTFVTLVVVTILAMAGIALAATDPNIIPPPNLQPNDGAIQAYCDEEYPGTTGIVFSTGSATTNSQGALTKTEAGYTLTWIESTSAADDYDIRVVSITEDGSPELLQFEAVFAFLGGNDLNGYDFGEEPLPTTTADLNVTGGNGQNVTHFGFCAVTTGEIIIAKVTNPSPSDGEFDFTASWDADGFTLADGETELSGRLDDGVYSVAEIVPDGWDLTSATCDDGSPIDAIDLQIAETITCTFVNEADSNIIIRKETDPDGSTQVFDFTADYGAGSFQLSDGQSNDSGDIDPGTYEVSESVPDGWALSSAECDDGSPVEAISLQAGETVTCTFNNTQAGIIVIEKETDPATSTDRFTFNRSWGDDFELGNGDTNTSDPLPPGTYSVAEIVPDGWDLTDATCDDGSNPATIDLDPGETVTCTFINQADANIIVIKETDPADATDEFDFTTNYSAGFSLGNGDSDDSGDLDPGTYSVSETVPDGWDLDSATCDDLSDPSAISLQAGETVTCTFVNQKDSKIIVEKQTDPDGSAQLFDFSTDYGPGFQLADDGTNDSGDLPPDTYSVSETVPAGWEQTDVVCSDGSEPDAIELSAGEIVTCTFFNQADANIIVVKETDPADATDEFDFTTNYSAGFSLGNGDSDDSGDIGPGTYSVSENVPAGWELESATCDNGDDPSSIGLLAGETVTCTFFNQQDSKIIVEKQTDPDGSAQLFDFSTDYGPGFQLADDGTNDSGDLPPDTYSVSETVPAGWEQTGAECDNGDDPSSIELVAGDVVTCTFYNEADSGIIVQKITDPADATDEFTFTPSWGSSFELGNGGSNNSGELDPGLYSVTETVPDGWDLESATCDDGSNPAAINLAAGEVVTCTFVNQADANIVVEKQTDPDGSPVAFDFTASWDIDGFSLTDGQQEDSGDLDPGDYSVSETVPDGWSLESVECTDDQDPADLTLTAGETINCVFTNRQSGNIVIIKETDPGDSPVLFTFSSDYGDDFQLADGDSNDSGPLDPGTYSVTENVPDGWELVTALCSDGSPASAIELGAGETVTCTFSNQQLGTIIVEKETDPVGSLEAFTFSTDYLPDFQLADGESNNSGFLAWGTYSVAETVPDGWELKSATCDDGSNPAAIDLNPGETVICTFVNEADANIVVEKQTDPDGSTEVFTFSPSWGADFDLSDGQTNDSGDLDPGTYSVSEADIDGWDLTDATCDGGNDPDAIDLAAGETVTCVFTNTQRGMVELLKLNNGVEETTVEWTFTLDGPEVSTTDTTPPALLDFGGAKLIAGETYTVCETGVPAGWSTEWTVDGVVVTPYDPNAADPNASNDTWCVDIVVEPGQTLGIGVDNVPPPGGDQRTPGYWKNWTTCSPGNQARTAERNGGADAGFYLLDDVLPMVVGDFEIVDCKTGRLLLDRRDLDGKRNRKRASDAAYNLASHLIAAQANVAAGASVCPEVTQAIADANELLASIGFEGDGQYLGPKSKSPDRQLALEIAALLDAYNNGEVC